jgi:hypothetical protein
MGKNNYYLRKIIREIISEENDFLIEGIDIDEINKLVSFNNSHENNVDTSTILNPSFTKLNDINIISIFKRKKNDNKTDGNPLIYALKDINKWKFKNPKEDIINLLKQFIKITWKIEPIYDTIITIPSSNELNIKFLHRLNKIIKAENKITNYFHKLSADEVWEDFVDWGGIKNEYKNKYKYIFKNMLYCFQRMEKENNNIFSYKYIADIKLRKFIKQTMSPTFENPVIKYNKKINGKNILILDDTISSGKTISEATDQILKTFSPSSTTVITLFSKV